MIPDEPSGVGVLTLGGSSGRIDDARAALFARHGALAESIRWFGETGQNPGPYEIPVETFQTRIAALQEHCDRLIICGTSFGAEAALLTASLTPAVHAAIGFAPSDVVWAGVTEDGRQTSHWTYEGRPVPFVPFVGDWEPSDEPPSYAPLYAASRAVDPAATQRASIAVERIPEVVVIAGGDDRVWPSVDHCRIIDRRRADHGRRTTVVVSTDAGHRAILPGEPVVAGGQRMARGGSDAADRELGRLAWVSIRPLLQPS